MSVIFYIINTSLKVRRVDGIASAVQSGCRKKKKGAAAVRAGERKCTRRGLSLASGRRASRVRAGSDHRRSGARILSRRGFARHGVACMPPKAETQGKIAWLQPTIHAMSRSRTATAPASAGTVGRNPSPRPCATQASIRRPAPERTGSGTKAGDQEIQSSTRRRCHEQEQVRGRRVRSALLG